MNVYKAASRIRLPNKGIRNKNPHKRKKRATH